MKKILFFLLLILSFTSCMKGIKVDLVIHNARIHTMDEKGNVFDAMAIRDGKIIEVGPERQILNKYLADEEFDAKGKDVFPGFTDAHTHLFSYLEQKLSVNLFGAKSWESILYQLQKAHSKNPNKALVGRGWDEANWGSKSFPDNSSINQLFPNIPVILIRTDGHTALVNDFLLAKLNPESKIDGGEIEHKNGKATGILIDHAVDLAMKFIPKHSEEKMTETMMEIQNELLSYGITNVHEAGITQQQVQLLKKWIDKNVFHINIYGMLQASPENITFAKKNGAYRHKNLSIRSFKIMLDGALGSRGAWLKESYSDRHGHQGLVTFDLNEFKNMAFLCESIGYQMNTHAIGDAANHEVLQLCKSVFDLNKDHRWRVEHAQVIDPSDIALFGQYGVFPSVQPTHAVSDQRWAKERIGTKRMAGAYAYRTILESAGMIALGTDFPVEAMDPFATLFAATQRKNTENLPKDGFYANEALDFENAIKGMTIWPAYAAFEESRLGSLEKSKEATFVIFDKPVKNYTNYTPNFALKTFIKGKILYDVE